ncbi:MAG: glycosyltransferase family 2 protein [Chloroflexi bacterium]|nr:glycosyltransferase family 2 protein [Chloroflexota bacterium]
MPITPGLSYHSSAEARDEEFVEGSDRSRRPLDLTVVVPVYNEAESLKPLYAQLAGAMQDGESEVIFVDDGSSDGSFQVLQGLHEMDPRVKAIRFRRNFGKTAALMAGFKLARGQKVVTIDADLQDDPAEITNLCSKLDEGYDLVSAWRARRIDPWSKRLPSSIFNWIVRSLTGIHLHDFNCGLKAYRSEVVEDLRLYGELHRFIPVLANWKGFKVAEVPVNHRPRKYGRSKYGAKRLAAGLLDFAQVLFLTSYMRSPLRLFGTIGLTVFAVGLIFFAYLVALWFSGESIGQRPLLILSVLMMVAGLQLFITGLIGEMLRHVTYDPKEEYSVAQMLD